MDYCEIGKSKCAHYKLNIIFHAGLEAGYDGFGCEATGRLIEDMEDRDCPLDEEEDK